MYYLIGSVLNQREQDIYIFLWMVKKKGGIVSFSLYKLTEPLLFLLCITPISFFPHPLWMANLMQFSRLSADIIFSRRPSLIPQFRVGYFYMLLSIQCFVHCTYHTLSKLFVQGFEKQQSRMVKHLASGDRNHQI